MSSYHYEEELGQIVGRGAQATVYAKGEYAVKLYREGYPKGNVFSEAYIMANLERENFPSPKVYEVLLVNGQYGIRMDLVKGETMAGTLGDPATREETLKRLVELQCRLQRHGDVEWAPDLKMRLRMDLMRNSRLSEGGRQKLLEELERLPEGRALCHCDFHAGNVFFDGMKYTIIDLLQISRGDPAADAACSYLSYRVMDENLAENYLDLYCQTSGIHRKDVLQWLAVYAGTLLGQVPEKYLSILEGFVGMGEENDALWKVRQ